MIMANKDFIQMRQERALANSYKGGGMSSKKFVDAASMDWAEGTSRFTSDIGFARSSGGSARMAEGASSALPADYLNNRSYQQSMNTYRSQAASAKAQHGIMGQLGIPENTYEKPVFKSSVPKKPPPGLFHGPEQQFVKKAAGKAKRGSMLGTAYRSTNAVSKAVLGVSVGKLALGAGLAVGALALVDKAIGRDPFSDAGSAVGGVQRFGASMKQASAPRGSYGHSQFQQSTQGLTFGLHNARTSN